MTQGAHIPVLLSESLELLAPRSGGLYCDGTLGLGGHAEAILKASSPSGRLLGVDRDPRALDIARARLARFSHRTTLTRGRLSDLGEILVKLGLCEAGSKAGPLDGLILDLGVSSLQLDDPERGFSFRQTGPIDMRMDPEAGCTAREMLLDLTEEKLAHLLRTLSDQRRPRAVARAIKAYLASTDRPDTPGLARAVEACLPRRKTGEKHPATKSFMAIRMALNEEISELEAILERIPEILSPGGRMVVISFHSTEDRIVKRRFAALCKPGADLPPGLPITAREQGEAPCVSLTPRALMPGDRERQVNPRARSAKLRAIARKSTGEAWA